MAKIATTVSQNYAQIEIENEKYTVIGWSWLRNVQTFTDCSGAPLLQGNAYST